ncbi:MAG: hypothetical protein FWE53_03085 [Firmicutes bacterium]|nr:hypothetical protein [Bacillota bacterium]
MLRVLLIIALAVSAASLILGAVLLGVSCDGSCGSDVHGGMLTWVCPKFWFPPVFSVGMIVFGGIGAISAGIFWLLQSIKGNK